MYKKESETVIFCMSRRSKSPHSVTWTSNLGSFSIASLFCFPAVFAVKCIYDKERVFRIFESHVASRSKSGVSFMHKSNERWTRNKKVHCNKNNATFKRIHGRITIHFKTYKLSLFNMPFRVPRSVHRMRKSTYVPPLQEEKATFPHLPVAALEYNVMLHEQQQDS